MKKNFRSLVFLALGTMIISCSKDDQTRPKSNLNAMAAVESTANSPLHSIDTVSQWYLGTAKVELKKYWKKDWSPNVVWIEKIANETLTIDFNTGMWAYKPDPKDYFWGMTPFVECDGPIFIMSKKSDNVNMHLSKKVTLFGFELSPQSGSTFEITVSYYDSNTRTKVGSLVKKVFTSHTNSRFNKADGARMYAVSSTVPFDEVRIKMTKTFDPNFTSPGAYQLANFHYVLAK